MDDRKKRFELALTFTLISAVFNAFFGFFSKEGTTVTSIVFLVFIRFAIPLVIIVPFILSMKSLRSFGKMRNTRNQVLRAMAVIITQYSLFFYLTKTSLLNATMLWNTGPVFVPIIASLFYRQKISRITWFSSLVALVGVICVIKPSSGIFDPYSVFGLIAGIGQGYSLVLYGINRVHHDTKENLIYFYGFTSFFALIILIATNGVMGSTIEISPKITDLQAIGLFLAMSLCSIFSQTFKGIAFNYKKPASLSPFFYFSVIIAGGIDWIFYNHPPDFLAVVGTLLVIMGSFIKWSYATKH